MLKIKQKGDFSELDKFFKKSVKINKVNNITTIANECIRQLEMATPVDSGVTAKSWSYNIIRVKNKTTLEILNSNIQNGVNVVILLEYGHASRSGKWIPGKNFVDPIIVEAYNKILSQTWKELTKL